MDIPSSHEKVGFTENAQPKRKRARLAPLDVH